MIPKDIKGICDLFDCSVCTDISTKGISTKYEPVYYIGAYPELSAGLNGFNLTGCFFSMVALEKFCRSKKGHNFINNSAKLFNDWDSIKEEWSDNI